MANVTFERDGRVVLETSYQDGGLADAAAVWRYLGRKPIIVEEPTLIVADASDPTHAHLVGDVTISIRHAGRLIARANVPRLTLMRDDPADARWFLPGEQVERTARAAGLGPAVPPGSRASWWIGAGARPRCAAACGCSRGGSDRVRPRDCPPGPDRVQSAGPPAGRPTARFIGSDLMSGRRIGGVVCCLLAAALFLVGVSATIKGDGLAIGNASGLGVSQAVGRFLPSLLVLALGLALLQKKPDRR